jgi:outer membrane receptor for ferrienterochelin and colicin
MITLKAMRELKMHLNWLYATGVPDRLDLFSSGNDRLGDYSRIDVSVEYSWAFSNQKLNIQAGIYNLMNRNNPWYRDWVLTIEERTIRNRFTPVQADVYDLGFQPSFSVSYHF